MSRALSDGNARGEGIRNRDAIGAAGGRALKVSRLEELAGRRALVKIR